MNQETIAERLAAVTKGKQYTGSLTPYAVQSILKGRSNYPIANLVTFCQDSDIRIEMSDMATEDCFYPESVLDVHKILDLLMKRYNIDYKLVYRKTGAHYTAPKSFDEAELEKMKAQQNDNRSVTPLSVKTLLAVCEVIHCDLRFIPK